MASAGKVSPIVKGTWNSAVSYTRLDIVSNTTNTKSYIARKDSINVPLENTEYWQILADVIDSADKVKYDNIVSKLTATNAQDAIDEVYGGIGAIDTKITTHKDSTVVSESGVHDLRYNTEEEVLQAKVDGEWVDCGGGTPTSSQITVTTATPEYVGKDVVLSLNGAEVSRRTFDSTKVVVFSRLKVKGLYKVTCEDAEAEVNVTEFGVDYSASVDSRYATIKITTTSTELFSSQVDIKKADGTVAASSTFSATGVASANVREIATYTVSATYDGKEYTNTVNVTSVDKTEFGTTITVNKSVITVTTTSDELKNKSVALKLGSVTKDTKTFNPDNVEFTVYDKGTYTVECEGFTAEVEVTESDIANNVAKSVSIESSIHITLTLEGAKEDTITITDKDGANVGVCVFPSGSVTGTVELDIVGGDEYTFTSSVAKDIETGTGNYSKNVTLTKSSSNVLVMPEHIVYWFGNAPYGLDKTTVMTWSSQDSSIGFITENKNNLSAINVLSPSSIYASYCISSVKKIPSASFDTIKGIMSISDANQPLYKVYSDDISSVTADGYLAQFIQGRNDNFQQHNAACIISAKGTNVGNNYLLSNGLWCSRSSVTPPLNKGYSYVGAIWLE